LVDRKLYFTSFTMNTIQLLPTHYCKLEEDTSIFSPHDLEKFITQQHKQAFAEEYI